MKTPSIALQTELQNDPNAPPAQVCRHDAAWMPNIQLYLTVSATLQALSRQVVQDLEE